MDRKISTLGYNIFLSMPRQASAWIKKYCTLGLRFFYPYLIAVIESITLSIMDTSSKGKHDATDGCNIGGENRKSFIKKNNIFLIG